MLQQEEQRSFQSFSFKKKERHFWLVPKTGKARAKKYGSNTKYILKGPKTRKSTARESIVPKQELILSVWKAPKQGKVRFNKIYDSSSGN